MVAIAKAVDDPEIEIPKRPPALLGNIADIGRVGGTTDAVAERGNIAMLDIERRKRDGAALAFNGTALAAFNRMTIEDRRILASFRRHETVREPRHDVLGGRHVEIGWNAAPLMQHDRTKIVDPV